MAAMCALLTGSAMAQPAQIAPVNPMQLKKVTPGVSVTPLVVPNNVSRIAPGVTLPVDPEAQVQAEIKRLQKQRDAINRALAQVGSNFSKLTYTPVTGNSCIDPDTTWNARSGESYVCTGMTSCTARMARWSRSRTNPCEAGVTINSCVISDECKSGSVCDTGAKRCIRQ